MRVTAESVWFLRTAGAWLGYSGGDYFDARVQTLWGHARESQSFWFGAGIGGVAWPLSHSLEESDF